MLSKNTMKEVIESDKQIIERITKELAEVREEKNELQEKQNQMESIFDSLGIKDNFDDFINFIKFIYEYKNEFKEFINMKKNNNNKDFTNSYNIEENQDYIKLKQINDNNNKKILDLESKLEGLTSNIENNILFKQLKEQNALLSENNKTLNNNFNKLNKDFETFKNKQGIPTPSNSYETKNKNKKNKKKDNVSLPDNLIDVVYYRNIDNNSFLPSYNTNNGIAYLNCCGKKWDYKELTNENGVTCLKCYKTYKLNNNKLINEILQNHIIPNEEELLKKIKCNNSSCNNIYKKEIELCNSCKYVYGCNPIITDLPEDNVGINTIKEFASETFKNIHFNANIYDLAIKEGIDVYTMKPLVKFIKENNLLKEKQPNVIIRKILRCRSILSIYNESKYKNIQDIIKRVYINIDYLPKLDDYQFNYFKDILINILDDEMKKNNENIENTQKCDNNSNVKETNKEEKQIINEDTNIVDIDIEKVNKMINKNYTFQSDKDDNICIILNCKNKRSKIFGNVIEYCKEHTNNTFSFDF